MSQNTTSTTSTSTSSGTTGTGGPRQNTANPTANASGQSMPNASASASAGLGTSPEERLYGKLDAGTIRNNIRTNTYAISAIKGIVESKKVLFIYQSAADPFNVCIKFLSQADYTFEDLVILFSQVHAFGRSLKSLNKQKDNDVGKKFFEICNKYRVKPNYDQKKLDGQARNFVTKVEHVFAAFPLVAGAVLKELVAQGLMNLTTIFTPLGLDFQSSTALAIWSDANRFLRELLTHEAKNQAYIAVRTSAQDNSALFKDTTYKGEKMNVMQARNRQAIDSRQYIILGMVSPDYLIKLLWSVEINVPPYKSFPAYRFVAEAAREAITGNNTLHTVKETESYDQFMTRTGEIADRYNVNAIYKREADKDSDEEWSTMGLSMNNLEEKLRVFADICGILGVVDAHIPYFEKFFGTMGTTFRSTDILVSAATKDTGAVIKILEDHFTGSWTYTTNSRARDSGGHWKAEQAKAGKKNI